MSAEKGQKGEPSFKPRLAYLPYSHGCRDVLWLCKSRENDPNLTVEPKWAVTKPGGSWAGKITGATRRQVA